MRKLNKRVNYFPELTSKCYYHIYNRTNNRELLFKNDKDRAFFLLQYQRFLSDYVDTFSFVLLGNHFHFSIRVKSVEEIEAHLQKIPKKKLIVAQKVFLDQNPFEKSVKDVLQRQFNRLFNSYSKKFNLKYGRRGNLFHRRFKRIKIESAEHFTMLIFYHHINPRKHGLFYDFKKYKWSSYQTIISDKPTKLKRASVLDWFGGKQAFIDFHNVGNDLKGIADLMIEED